MRVLSRLTASALLTSLAFSALGGCQSTPVVQPRQWYLGRTTVEPAGATVFGPAGSTAMEWQIVPADGDWIWRDYRDNGWREVVAWKARNGSQFNADVGTGAWSGVVSIADVAETGLFQPWGWHYKLTLTDGSGTIVGSGQTDGAGPMLGSGSQWCPRFWVDQRWIKSDGSVGATMHQEFSACNAEEFRNAVQASGNPLPDDFPRD